MLVKLTEIQKNGIEWELNEIFVNPEHISMVKEVKFLQKLNEGGYLPKNLDIDHRFSRIVVKSRPFLVVGAPEFIARKLRINPKQLLRG